MGLPVLPPILFPWFLGGVFGDDSDFGGRIVVEGDGAFGDEFSFLIFDDSG